MVIMLLLLFSFSFSLLSCLPLRVMLPPCGPDDNVEPRGGVKDCVKNLSQHCWNSKPPCEQWLPVILQGNSCCLANLNAELVPRNLALAPRHAPRDTYRQVMDHPVMGMHITARWGVRLGKPALGIQWICNETNNKRTKTTNMTRGTNSNGKTHQRKSTSTESTSESTSDGTFPHRVNWTVGTPQLRGGSYCNWNSFPSFLSFSLFSCICKLLVGLIKLPGAWLRFES